MTNVFTAPENSAALRDVRGRLIQNRRIFRAFERYALAAADPARTAGRIELAASVAMHRHPGLLASAGLEQRLAEIGSEFVSTPHRFSSAGGKQAQRVLHVMTEAYDSGGHTRVVERWMAADAGRVPTVAITGWNNVAPPATLHAAAHGAGGTVVSVPGEDVLTRARNLRGLAQQHDLVVLHVHEFDPIPAIALAQANGRPPTVFFNHAGHEFLIGTGAADVVANLHEVDVLHTCQRRGLDTEGSLLLPIPIVPRQLPDRADARSQLDLDPDAEIILVVGSAYKVANALQPTFPELVRSVMRAAPRAIMVAVGPVPQGEWAVLQAEFDGRVMPIGLQPNPMLDLLLPAADVLLDTWPLTGWTTLLDAAYAQVPAVSFGGGSLEHAMVRPPDGALDGSLTHAGSSAELALAVADLLDDPARRAALGRQARHYVERVHMSGWHAQMDAVVSAALNRAGAASPPRTDPPGLTSDWECLVYMIKQAGAQAIAPDELMLRHAPALAADERQPNPQAAAAQTEAVLAQFGQRPRRAVASPAVTVEAITKYTGQVWQLVEADSVDMGVAVIEPARLAEAVPLFEQAMGLVPEIDIELVTAHDIGGVMRPDDLALDSDETDLGDRQSHGT